MSMYIVYTVRPKIRIALPNKYRKLDRFNMQYAILRMVFRHWVLRNVRSSSSEASFQDERIRIEHIIVLTCTF